MTVWVLESGQYYSGSTVSGVRRTERGALKWLKGQRKSYIDGQKAQKYAHRSNWTDEQYAEAPKAFVGKEADGGDKEWLVETPQDTYWRISRHKVLGSH